MVKFYSNFWRSNSLGVSTYCTLAYGWFEFQSKNNSGRADLDGSRRCCAMHVSRICVLSLHNTPLLFKVGSADSGRCSWGRVTLWELPRSLAYATKPKSARTLMFPVLLHRRVLGVLFRETRADFKRCCRKKKKRKKKPRTQQTGNMLSR